MTVVAQAIRHLPAMQETRFDLGDPLEKEMATHSSILAWRIPWTEEPGWLQSMGSLRVWHELTRLPSLPLLPGLPPKEPLAPKPLPEMCPPGDPSPRGKGGRTPVRAEGSWERQDSRDGEKRSDSGYTRDRFQTNRSVDLWTQSTCLHLLLPLCLGGDVLVAESCPTLATPRTVARQAPLSMGFSRQEYWSGLPFPSPGDLPYPGIEPGSPARQAWRGGWEGLRLLGPGGRTRAWTPALGALPPGPVPWAEGLRPGS